SKRDGASRRNRLPATRITVHQRRRRACDLRADEDEELEFDAGGGADTGTEVLKACLKCVATRMAASSSRDRSPAAPRLIWDPRAATAVATWRWRSSYCCC